MAAKKKSRVADALTAKVMQSIEAYREATEDGTWVHADLIADWLRDSDFTFKRMRIQQLQGLAERGN